MGRSIVKCFFGVATLGIAACGGAPAEAPDAAADVTDAALAQDAAMAPDTGSLDAGAEERVRILAEFDGASFELPESVAFHDGRAYASFLNGAVVAVDAAGTVTPFGSIAIEPPGSAYALGIGVGADGAVYVAMALASATSTFAAGIYRIAPTGGAGSIYASHPDLFIPNDVDLDDDGTLYITADGALFRARAAGTAELWVANARLASSTGPEDAPCGARTSPFPIGANGIEVDASRIVVGNTERGEILAVRIEADGSAGAIETIASQPAELCGIDGLVADGEGGFLATTLGRRLVRVAGGTIATVHEGLPFRSPAGVDVGVFGGSRSALVVNPDFDEAFGPGGPPSAMPNLSVVRL